ncbi:hypothetical protein PIB30_014753 [Stylosanthes scabra]|uniref:Uncharacterized protein n=1 Tax=Stylosanthes scabra TaxID=79078 RepID=A0ABU6X708_9FABA|nr:hypothetical protein [Stylosanthes scabra]
MCTSKSHTDSCTNGSSKATVSSGTRMSEDGSSPTQDSSRDGICDEGAILKVMAQQTGPKEPRVTRPKRNIQVEHFLLVGAIKTKH